MKKQELNDFIDKLTETVRPASRAYGEKWKKHADGSDGLAEEQAAKHITNACIALKQIRDYYEG
jgi:hypothetical protein